MYTVSPAGRAALMQREGLRLKAYRDSVGVWTIGVGHTGRMSAPKVTPGMVITRAQADAFLAADLAPVEAAINGNVKAALTQNQVDALASLAFNIGVPRFVGSTVLRKLNAGDTTGAAEAILLWCKPAVLKARREAERAQFLTPDAPISSSRIIPETVSKGSGLAPISTPEKASGITPPPCSRPDCPLRATSAPKPAPNAVHELLR